MTRKSLRCSLNCGMSLFRLNSPFTTNRTWTLEINIISTPELHNEIVILQLTHVSEGTLVLATAGDTDEQIIGWSLKDQKLELE